MCEGKLFDEKEREINSAVLEQRGVETLERMMGKVDDTLVKISRIGGELMEMRKKQMVEYDEKYREFVRADESILVVKDEEDK